MGARLEPARAGVFVTPHTASPPAWKSSDWAIRRGSTGWRRRTPAGKRTYITAYPYNERRQNVTDVELRDLLGLIAGVTDSEWNRLEVLAKSDGRVWADAVHRKVGKVHRDGGNRRLTPRTWRDGRP